MSDRIKRRCRHVLRMESCMMLMSGTRGIPIMISEAPDFLLAFSGMMYDASSVLRSPSNLMQSGRDHAKTMDAGFWSCDFLKSSLFLLSMSEDCPILMRTSVLFLYSSAVVCSYSAMYNHPNQGRYGLAS